MTTLSKAELEKTFVKLQSLHKYCEDIENGTTVTFAGETVDVPASKITDAKVTVNTLLASIQVEVAAFEDVI